MHAGKVILFDLGGVLIENNGRAALTAMLPRPLPASEMWRKWLDSPVVRLFERGHISADEFASGFVREWDLKLEPAEFIREFATWPVGLYDGAEVLLRGLKGTHRLACLSNTNAIHWQRFPQLHALFDSCFLSHEMGHVKPDREAFTYAVESLGVAPAEVYFFDDLLPNVAAAREVGMNAFQVDDFAGIGPILSRERLLVRAETVANTEGVGQ
jgi:putative hydrolase of the HAD superfamily